MQNLGRKYQSVPTTRQAVAEGEKYTVLSYFSIFMVFAMFGWVWEFLVNYLMLDRVINPGFLHGPWVPIYGAGSVLMLFLFQFFKKNPLQTFLLNMIICGVIEYITSYVLEKLYGTLWWDYSDEFLNLDGRVCLTGLLIFGIGGCFIIYIAAPAINHLIQNHSMKMVKIIVTVFASLFLLDLVFSACYPNFY